MKVTFILKDFSDSFYQKLSLLDIAAKFDYLKKHDLITSKVGNGSFRDKVDLNSLMKRPHNVSFALEPRRGYKLATFIFSPQN